MDVAVADTPPWRTTRPSTFTVPLTFLIAIVWRPGDSGVSNNTRLRPVKEAKSTESGECPSMATAATPFAAAPIQATDVPVKLYVKVAPD
jgi:hypothetical protein